jgi:polysaccharide pyruvyl transferase WcaK-like protein
MAFMLYPIPAEDHLEGNILNWVTNKIPEKPLYGINVSGLIYNDAQSAVKNYGFKANYQNILIHIMDYIMKNTNANIVLISHVMDKPGHFESDHGACLDIIKRVDKKYCNRIAVAPAKLNESQVKWLISNMDWFCGTRMHSTIAGLSSCVPTTTISYSDKAKGVFDSCGQLDCVIDPRCNSTEQAIEAIISNIKNSKNIKLSLQKTIPSVIEKSKNQIKEISSFI